MDRLSYTSWFEVLSYCQNVPAAIGKLSGLSKGMRDSANDAELWHLLFKSRFNYVPDEEEDVAMTLGGTVSFVLFPFGHTESPRTAVARKSHLHHIES